MFNFMTNIRSSDVIVKTLRVIFYHYLTLAFRFVFPLYKFLLNVIVAKWFDK